MSVYIDKHGHLTADTDLELHCFALRIGLKEEWFQKKRLPHYDCTTPRMISKAIRCGARLVNEREIVRKIKET